MIALKVLYAKKKKYILSTSQNTTQSVKSKLFFNDCKIYALLRGITSKCHDDVYCLNCLHSFGTKTNLNHIKSMSK